MSASATTRIGADRPKLVIIEGLILASPADPYLALRALAQYSGCSVRWLRDRLRDLSHPLPHYRLPGGKILVQRSEFDGWVQRYRQMGDAEVERVVAEVLQGVGK